MCDAVVEANEEGVYAQLVGNVYFRWPILILKLRIESDAPAFCLKAKLGLKRVKSERLGVCAWNRES